MVAVLTASATAAAAPVEDVSAGGAHSCAIRVGGELACWGDDSAGQLQGIPEGQFTAVSAGGAHSCAIRVGGELACWGDDSAGQLQGIPEGQFTAVSAGGAHSCAIRVGGELACWGDDSAGQLDGVPWWRFRAVSAGGAHTCAISLWEHLKCWGDDSADQVRGLWRTFDFSHLHHHHNDRHHHHDKDDWPEFASVAAGSVHTCAVAEWKELGCWGDDSAGQRQGIPEGQFAAVSAGGTHSCAIRVGGELACWGDDSAGQLQGIAEGQFTAVSAGGTHTCAIRVGGEPTCWGDNGVGQVTPWLTGLEPLRAVIGEHFEHSFGTSPQSPAPSFSQTGGALPDGFGLDPAGVLSGTPTAAGLFTFSLAATNGITPDATGETSVEVVGAPMLSVDPAQDVTTTSAKLSGKIDPRNLAATAWFEYWPASGSPAGAVRTPEEAVPAGLSPTGLSATIDGLSPDTAYEFRLAATNELGADPVHSDVEELKTAAPPPAPLVLAAPPPGLPPPTAGKTVNVKSLRGVVRSKCPRQRRYGRIKGERQLSIACLIDTRRGTAGLTTAKGGTAGTQSARFWGGIFGVNQDAKDEWDTELRLAGRLKCERRKSEGGQTSQRQRKRRGKRRGRRLWGSGKGNFRTNGNYGSASVRGTTWLVVDRCDGSTLFAVREGTVSVHDFAKDITVIIRPGQTYVAKAAIPRLR